MLLSGGVGSDNAKHQSPADKSSDSIPSSFEVGIDHLVWITKDAIFKSK